MLIDIVDSFGGKTIRMPASQVVVRTDDGTPISLASVYGPEGSYLVEQASGDPQAQARFQRALRSLGLDHAIIVANLDAPPPPRDAPRIHV